MSRTLTNKKFVYDYYDQEFYRLCIIATLYNILVIISSGFIFLLRTKNMNFASKYLLWYATMMLGESTI